MRAALLVLLVASCGPSATKARSTTGHHDDDPDAPRRTPYILTETEGTTLTATDARYLYWVDQEGLKRRPHGGPEQKIELVTAEMAPYATSLGAMLVVGDTAYVFNAAEVVSVSLAKHGAEPQTLVTMPADVNAFTISADGHVYIASQGQVLEIIAGKEPRVLAKDQGAIEDVIAGDDAIYFGTDTAGIDGAPPAPLYYGLAAPTTGALRKVPRDGGAVVELATEVTPPGALALFDGRLYWVAVGGPAVSSVPIGGGDVRVEAMGHADALAIDDGGLVYRQDQGSSYTGMIVEHRHDAWQVDFVPDGTFDNARRITLSPDWVYVEALRTGAGTPAILALPRQDQPVKVAFALDRMFQRMQVDDTGVYWTEMSRDGDGHTHLMRGDPATGARTELADLESSVSELSLGGGQLYFDDNYSISQISIEGGEVHNFNGLDSSWVTGLTAHRNHVYWFDGSALYARKRRGGSPFAMVRTNGEFYGNDYYGYTSTIAFDDEHAYVTGFGQGSSGIYEISENGRLKILWNGGGGTLAPSKLVSLGDELFFLVAQGGTTVMKLDGDGDPVSIFQGPGEGYGADLIEEGGMLYLQTVVESGYTITRIDPSTGEGHAIFRISGYGNGDYPALGADADGLYVALDSYDAIFRIDRDAPDVQPMGWPPTGE